MATLIIDNKTIEVKPGTRLIEAARQNGIDIPSLCYHRDLPHYSSCMVCMVKDTVKDKFIPSCSAIAEDGMEIDASGDDVIRLRREALSMLLSEHRAECEAPCRLVCPAGLNIPLLNRYLSAGEISKAGELAFTDMGLPSISCMLCPAYCENACRRKMIDHSIAISELVTRSSQLFNDGVPLLLPPAAKKIAIAGGGASGLITAFNLTLEGHLCTIFEKEQIAGGSINEEFRKNGLQSHIADDEIRRLLASGININYGVTVDESYIKEKLIPEYDAIIIATSTPPVLAGAEIAASFILTGGDTLILCDKHLFLAGNAAKENKQIIRRLGQAKKTARGIGRFLASGETGGETKRFNSTTGAIAIDEKHEWLKECPESSTRYDKPSGVEQMTAEALNCLHCDCRASSDCQLRDLCDRMEVKNPKEKQSGHPIQKKIDKQQRVIFEQAKCIKCGLCVRVTNPGTNEPSLCFTGRGFMTLISEPLAFSFTEITGRDIERAINICPTGALTWRK